ncbi:hypothetical protein BN2497_3599 [Janthinobacterium sp. CG23_2]|nr:hypothetical protein BN2497_3599 [Janthinobacterium sp. CG23_2]CUU28197.1 hypothetical protein BN3177_3599 [Janthinobacterium sp. CG23_2]
MAHAHVRPHDKNLVNDLGRRGGTRCTAKYLNVRWFLNKHMHVKKTPASRARARNAGVSMQGA